MKKRGRAQGVKKVGYRKEGRHSKENMGFKFFFGSNHYFFSAYFFFKV